MKNNKKPFPYFDIILTSLTIILIGASAYLLYLFNSDSSASSSIPKNPDDVPSTIDETDSNFAGIKIITEIANDAETPFAIQYPQSNHTAFNDKVKKYIQRLKYDYFTNIADYKKDHKDFTSELNISFETFQHPNGLYSFVIVNNESIDEQDGKMAIETFHLNPETGDMPMIQEVIGDEDGALQQLSEIAAKSLTEDNEFGNHLSTEEIESLTVADAENYNQFAFTEDHLVLYFTKHQSKDGTPIISMPYDDVNEVLAADFQTSEKDVATTPNTSTGKKNESDGNDQKEDASGEDDKKEVSNEKRVALTFDDGPDPLVTVRVLEILEKYDAKATFYMLGSRVEFYPEIAKKVQEAGHELGNHSWTHPDLSKASVDKISEEIHRTSEIIEEVTGEKPFSFRPPYGAFNDVVKQQTDLPIALWDVDTLDWKHRSGSQLLPYVQDSVKDGSIILMHDIHQSTADGLDAVMAFLKDNGYTFVTVSDLME